MTRREAELVLLGASAVNFARSHAGSELRICDGKIVRRNVLARSRVDTSAAVKPGRAKVLATPNVDEQFVDLELQGGGTLHYHLRRAGVRRWGVLDLRLSDA